MNGRRRPAPGPTDAQRAAMDAARAEVRAFLSDAVDRGTFVPECDGWLSGFDPGFSRQVGARGWIGMTFPREHGGRAASQLERFAVVEELLAWGAPVAAHWFADRQVGPSLLRNGTPAQRARFLPAIARGVCYFAIGLSEPDSGSDLASLRTTARRDGDRWVIDGAKVWTSNAHRCHYAVVLCRTPPTDDGDMTQLVVDLAAPGITIRPIRTVGGEEHFCEVFFDGVTVDDDAVLGAVGGGWRQALTELADERSGPERYLSTMPLLRAWLAELGGAVPDAVVGRAYAELAAVREASVRVATTLENGGDVAADAALVKDVGTRLEQDLVDLVREHSAPDGRSPALDGLLAAAARHAPGFTLRGGTTEVLRSIVGKALR